MNTMDLEAVKKQVAQCSRDWCAEMNRRDLDGSLKWVAAEAVFLPPGEAPIREPEAIREFMIEFLEPLESISWESEKVEVAASGDLAYCLGPYRFAMKGPEGPEEFEGVGLEVWKKIQGEWKCVINSW